MNEKELGAALVKTAGQEAAAEQIAEKLFARDRRSVWLWTVLTILAWLPAVGLALGVVVYLALLFPMLAKVQGIRAEQRGAHHHGHDAHLPDTHLHEGSAINLPELERDLEIQFKMMSVLTGFGLLALAFATLFSLLLTHTTRRATLRQISVSLAGIAAAVRK